MPEPFVAATVPFVVTERAPLAEFDARMAIVAALIPEALLSVKVSPPRPVRVSAFPGVVWMPKPALVVTVRADEGLRLWVTSVAEFAAPEQV
jgi:hypothetical protein